MINRWSPQVTHGPLGRPLVSLRCCNHSCGRQGNWWQCESLWSNLCRRSLGVNWNLWGGLCRTESHGKSTKRCQKLMTWVDYLSLRIRSAWFEVGLDKKHFLVLFLEHVLHLKGRAQLASVIKRWLRCPQKVVVKCCKWFSWLRLLGFFELQYASSIPPFVSGWFHLNDPDLGS